MIVRIVSAKQNRNIALRATLLAALLAAPEPTQASVVVLSDGNSQANLDLDSAAGMNNWSVDGQNQLNQQWFWFRVGGAIPAPINAISSSSVVYNDSSTLVANYANAQVSLDITYVLTGGASGSGTADILESITVNNLTGSPLDFHFYQYSDFNLLGSPGGDSIAINGSPGSGYDYVFQFKGPTQIQEAITSPMADRAEAGIYASTLNNLNTVAGYDLNNTDLAGPGDVTWALQWDVSIAPGGSFDIFKDKLLSIQPIPEPAAAALFVLGAALTQLARSQRKS